MNKIKALYLSQLTNPKHINYMLFVKKAIAKFIANDEKFAALIVAFNFAYDKEDQIYLKHQRKFLSEEIAACENVRDLAFRAFRNFLLSCSLLPVGEMTNAAKKLLEVIDLYGGAAIISKPWDAESGILSNMVEDFETVYAAQIETVGAGEFLANLKAANEDFLEKMDTRTQDDANYGKRALGAARRNTDDMYRALVYVINSYVTIGQGATYQGLINYLNAEIERYRIQLGIGVGPADSAEEFEPGEEETPTTPPAETEPSEPTTPPSNGTETEPVKYTVAWYQPNGNPIVWYELYPGETIPEAPECPEGYYWHPYPATMPDHDLDIIPERIKG